MKIWFYYRLFIIEIWLLSSMAWLVRQFIQLNIWISHCLWFISITIVYVYSFIVFKHIHICVYDRPTTNCYHFCSDIWVMRYKFYVASNSETYHYFYINQWWIQLVPGPGAKLLTFEEPLFFYEQPFQRRKSLST